MIVPLVTTNQAHAESRPVSLVCFSVNPAQGWRGRRTAQESMPWLGFIWDLWKSLIHNWFLDCFDTCMLR